MEGLSLYAKLMNEDPVYAMYAKLQSHQYYMQQPANAAQQVKPTCYRCGPAHQGQVLKNIYLQAWKSKPFTIQTTTIY